MIERVRRSLPEQGGSYFSRPSKRECIKSGCTLLDLILGGGWALGRISNVVGDKAVGKTLLAIEAAANFAAKYENGKVWYREAEAAFDKDYAAALGMPLDRVDFGKRKFDTVEDIFEDMESKIDWAEDHKAPGLYIVDSLDALSDRKEMAREIGEQGYHLEKQKLMGVLFRKLIRRVDETNIHVMFISQVRDKIGVTFGDRHTRSGGKALDFYASQILFLSHIGQISKTVKGSKRVVGVNIKAKCKKNKVGLSFRNCEFPLMFGWGIDDATANINYLKAAKQPIPDTDVDLRVSVRKHWRSVETSLLPKGRKYQ